MSAGKHCEIERKYLIRYPDIKTLQAQKGVEQWEIVQIYLTVSGPGETRRIRQVVCGGENYGGSRPCHFEWVTKLYDECVKADVQFAFIETGTVFVKDGKTYHIPGKGLQSKMAYRSGMRHEGKPMEFKLCDFFGDPIPKEQLYVKHYRENCAECGSRLICNGCSDCGRCEVKKRK